MGREIRRVPADWKHPKKQQPWGYDYQPMHDENFETARNEWMSNNALWKSNKHPDQLSDPEGTKDSSFAEWNGSKPTREMYRPYKDEECTHYQMYQTVSEGTPVTPVFANLLELEDYLVETGECAGTKYNRKYSREAAHAFCQSGWVPSAIGIPGKGIVDGVTALGL